MKRARLAISIGCPCGVGPEVSAEAALGASRTRAVLLVGGWDAVQRAARAKGLDARRFVRVEDGSSAWALAAGKVGVWGAGADGPPGPFGRPTPADGAAQLAWVDAACDLVSSGHADAMVTGPVSKEVIVSSGAKGSARFLGHTEHLQRRLRAPEVVMAFWNERFTTSLATTHLPLAKVPRAVTKEAVARATYWLARLALSLRSGHEVRPRIAICALNPHAGEGGLLGTEETRAIEPGIALARARLGKARVAIDGPLGAETAFRRAQDGRYDGVVAMYHDQATVPMKLVGFGESVNVSLALPILRTSVDHGTAYDIAGRGVADARGMREAITLAARLVTARAAGSRTRARR